METELSDNAVVSAVCAEENVCLHSKRRPEFEKSDANQRHQVVRHLREGANAVTDEKAIAPALAVLEGLLKARRDACEQKALVALDAFLELKGAFRAVEVFLALTGREIADEAAL